MSPSLNSKVVSMQEVPFDDLLEERGPSGKKSEACPALLIVDDEPLVANTLAAILSRSGFATHVAYNGHDALKLALAINPQLLISDIAMPEMTGVELALRLLQAHPACKILLFSGHATHADLAPAHAAGHEFTLLAKPVPPAVMLQNVAHCLAVSESAKMRTSQTMASSESVQQVA